MQRSLLDTHTLTWFINGDTNLSLKARRAIEAADVVNFISIASLWEISIKISLGRFGEDRLFFTLFSPGIF